MKSDTIKGLMIAFGLFWVPYGLLLLGNGILWILPKKNPEPFVVRMQTPPPIQSPPLVRVCSPAPALPERRVVAVASLPRVPDASQEAEETEEAMEVRKVSGGYVASVRAVESSEEDSGSGWVASGRARPAGGSWREADAENARTLDDFVGAVEPRRGQTIKTGSTAFREDGEMVVVTGSTIHTSRGMWVDTGGVILGPEGQSMLRVGSMIYEDGVVKSQKIGGDDGDYYLRNGYSLNQSSQTLTDFDE